MISLKIIKWFFPVSFQARFGEEWESASENIMARATSPLAAFIIFLRLIFDAFVLLPKMYAEALREVVIGHPEPVFNSYALGALRHWTVRPVQATGEFLYSHLLMITLGAAGAYVSYVRAYQAEITKYALSAEGDPQQASSFFMPLLVGVVVLLLLAGKDLFNQWRAKGFAVFGSLFAAFLGFSIGIHIIFGLKLDSVSENAIDVFVEYPYLTATPVARPNDGSLLSKEQNKWFSPELVGGGYVVRVEKKQEWCALKVQSLGAWERKIRREAFTNESAQSNALLFFAEYARHVEDGCASQEDFLNLQTEIAHLFQQGGSAGYQRTWSHFSAFPLINTLNASYWVVYPKLLPSIQKYCALSLAMNVKEKNQGPLDQSKAFAYCLDLENTLHPTTPYSLTAWEQFLERNNIHTLHNEKAKALQRKAMTQQELKIVQKETRRDFPELLHNR